MWISAPNISNQIDFEDINENQKSNTLTSVRDFFAEKVSLLLENKTYTAAAFTMMFAAGMNISDSQKTQEIEKVNTPAPQITLKITRNQWDNTKLWSVHFDGKEYNVNIDDKWILSQATKDDLDYEIFKWYIEHNEIWAYDFVNYLSQAEYEKKENTYSYKQLVEAVQDFHSLEYLIEQQSISESNKQEAQRIFNEKLRGKQKVRFLWSDIIKKSSKYDLILNAAGDNYQFVFWEKYGEYGEDIEDQTENQESMKKVTQRMDEGEYDENTLILYLAQFKSYIEFETGVSMDDYKKYIASVNNREMIAQNNIEKRENY